MAIQADSRPSEKTLDVVLIDDAPEEARLVREHLRAVPQEVSLQWWRDLAPALRDLQDARPSLVVVDPGFPDTEAERVIQQCLTTGPSVPVVVLIGEDTPEMTPDPLEMGATDSLRKETLSPDRWDR